MLALAVVDGVTAAQDDGVAVLPLKLMMEVADDGQLSVNVRLHNSGAVPLDVLALASPFEGDGHVRADLFEWLTAGSDSAEQQPPIFVGMSAKYVKPLYPSAAFVRVEPHSFLAASLPAALLQNYAPQRTGAHSVRMQWTATVYEAAAAAASSSESKAVTVTLLSNVVEGVQLRARSVHEQQQQQSMAPPAVYFNGESVGYIQCSAAQISSTNASIALALTGSQQSLTYLSTCSKSPQPNSTYVEWFGVHTTARQDTVRASFDKCVSFFAGGDFQIDCTNDKCTPFTFAWVNKFDFGHTIHVCGAYHNAPVALGRCDSAPGTLVHEALHFYNVGNTNDEVYGTNGCLQLAKDDPNKAIANSDSNERFFESLTTKGTSFARCNTDLLMCFN